MQAKFWSLLVILTAALLVAGGIMLVPGSAQTPVPEETTEPEALRSVSVTGLGRATTQPDIAMVRVGVTTEEETAGEALAQNSEQMQAMLNALRAQGVAQQDIRTIRLQLLPRYEDIQRPATSPVLAGFTAVNIVEATIRDINNVGQVLDAAIEAGGTTIEGIHFEVNDPSALLDQARAAAMEDAQNKATQLADLAGVEIGEVITITESSRIPFPAAREIPVAEAGVPVEPGVFSTELEVFVVWRIR